MLPYRSPTGNSGYGVVSRYPQVLTEADLSDEACPARHSKPVVINGFSL
jgi:hypothetical protein